MIHQSRAARCLRKALQIAESNSIGRYGNDKVPVRHRKTRNSPSTSSTCLGNSRSERVKQRLKPCPHWTHPKRGAAARILPSDYAKRCRQVSILRAKQRPRFDSLTPNQRITAQAYPKVSYCGPYGVTVKALRPSDGRSVSNGTINDLVKDQEKNGKNNDYRNNRGRSMTPQGRFHITTRITRATTVKTLRQIREDLEGDYANAPEIKAALLQREKELTCKN